VLDEHPRGGRVSGRAGDNDWVLYEHPRDGRVSGRAGDNDWVLDEHPRGGRVSGRAGDNDWVLYEHPVVLPQVVHFRQVPLRTSVNWPHSRHASPS